MHKQPFSMPLSQVRSIESVLETIGVIPKYIKVTDKCNIYLKAPERPVKSRYCRKQTKSWFLALNILLYIAFSC